MITYLMSNFTKEGLSNLVKECFGTNFPDIFKKKQIDYIYRYLNDLNAKSVLLESQYVDKDYLEDFNHYYVKCFGNNGFMSARLHFFSEKIDHQIITNCLADGDQKVAQNIKDAYLGFVVIKPLSKTFIGKTCLKTYPPINKEGTNKYCLERDYEVDLFGIPLKVTSVAFQEQDKVISACATTAIWSSLHAMHWKNVKEIRSCSEITTNALNHINGSNNSFPNRELSNKQILRALDFEKLKHHTIDVSTYKKEDFFNVIKIHIDSKVPLILGIDVYARENDSLRLLDGHAVTIVGYKSSESGEPSVYVHDDRLGPYARAKFFEIQSNEIGIKSTWGLALQEKGDDAKWKEPHEILIANSLIIPTQHKVRLPSSFAYETGKIIVSEYDDMLTELDEESSEVNVEKYRNKLKFNVELTEISKIRQELFYQNTISEDFESLRKDRVKFLTGSYARYQWVTSFSFESEPIFKILFDATDIPQGNAVSAVFIQNTKLANLVLDRHIKFILADSRLPDDDEKSFYGSFLKYLKPTVETLSAYLDQQYGELRAPKYIKDTEMLNGNIIGSSVKRYYNSIEKTLDEEFSEAYNSIDGQSLIWTISDEGVLLIGAEEGGKGHPTLTGFKPSRIAGELKFTNNMWVINSKSGRYSTDYSNTNELLTNAAEKFKDIFRNSRDRIKVECYKPS